MRSWKCRITAASLPGIEMASTSPSAVTGKYLAVWEKIGNDWKLECRFEDQWAGHGRVRSCMSHYRRYLSPACRAMFDGGAKKKKARRSR
jgi:hypothetical protein